MDYDFSDKFCDHGQYVHCAVVLDYLTEIDRFEI